MVSPCEPTISGSKTLTDALELCFERFGDNVAIDAPGIRVTYAALDTITCHVASELRSRCSDQQLKSEPIAILMSRSVDFYVAQIAILRAGGFFLPIDPLQPTERIEYLISDSQSSLLLVREGDSIPIKDSAVATFSVDAERWTEKQLSQTDQQPGAATGSCGKVDENDFAYMIYTSGSRGRPKGVAISHRSICNLCHCWSEEFALAQGQRTLQMMSVGFDASLEEIFPTLVTGGTLVPIQPEALNSMEQFLDFIRKQHVQMLHLPTAFWRALSASFETHDSLKLPASVMAVVTGGEKIDPIQVESWFSRFGTEVQLINAYGPTEATVAASYDFLRPGVQPSIGKPIRGVSFCVCDKDGQLVKPGQPGELYIGGAGVATGYWKRKELSAEKFVDSPINDGQPYYRTGDLVRLREDGNYEFIGRIDDQIKLRGYRIEPGEISTCLSTHPQVDQAHVIARKLSNDSNQHLVGYVVTKSGNCPDESEARNFETELRDFLSLQLPAYMVPTRIVVMESFPTTSRGKLDLDQFPSPSMSLVSDFDCDGEPHPLTPTEQKIAKVWENVLGTGRLNRDANFFHIGGDSLLAMRLVLLLESEFPGPVIPVAALIPNPTIAAMADYMNRRQHNSPETVSQNWPLLTRLEDSQQPISVACMHAAGGGGMFYRQLFEGFGRTASVAVLESAFLYQENSDIRSDQTIAGIARDYVDCLINAGCSQKLILVGYSFGSLLAFEMARLLKTQGYVVDKIINIDCPNPPTMKRRNRLFRLWHRFRSPGTLSDRIADYKSITQRKRRILNLERFKSSKLPPPVELRPLELELVFGAIAEKYIPEKQNISMHLIKGEYPEAMFHIPEDYGWTEIVSALNTVQIPGGHNTIFCQPYLQSLITVFQKALAE